MALNKPIPGSPTVRNAASPAGLVADQSDQQQPEQHSRPARWLVPPSRRLLASLLVGSLVMNVGLLLIRPTTSQTPRSVDVPEIPLGTFRYVAGPSKLGQPDEPTVSSAEFSLYVTLAESAADGGAELIAARRFRVQQAVEQLLRQAHGGDFQDPSLSTLKRQIREHINAVLGARAVAEVVLTDLKLQYRQPSPGQRASQTPTAERSGVPWKEPNEATSP